MSVRYNEDFKKKSLKPIWQATNQYINLLLNLMLQKVPLASGLINTGKNAFIPPIQHPSLMTQRKSISGISIH